MTWNWTVVQGRPPKAYADTEVGRYTITWPGGRHLRHVLTLNGRPIGILSDPAELRRLAETDFAQRTKSNETPPQD